MHPIQTAATPWLARLGACLSGWLPLAGCASGPVPGQVAAANLAVADEPPPQARPCPSGMPASWSGVLVLHAHGGPALGAPRADTDPGGRIPVPVLSEHAVDDPVAFVALASVFRDTMQRAGTAADCAAQAAGHGDGCRFLPGKQPAPLASKVPPRQRP
jgi:hypothetical protein